jgi:hypothetical protein
VAPKSPVVRELNALRLQASCFLPEKKGPGNRKQSSMLLAAVTIRPASQCVKAYGEERQPSFAGEEGHRRLGARVGFTNLMLPTLRAHGIIGSARVGKYLHHPARAASVACVSYGEACWLEVTGPLQSRVERLLQARARSLAS